MKYLTRSQIVTVIDWMNTYEHLKSSFIPHRFREDFNKKLQNEENTQIILDFLQWHNTHYPDNYIPNSRVGKYLKSDGGIRINDRPCICVSCPICDAVFEATALQEEYHEEPARNKEFLDSLAKYAQEGYLITVKDAADFKIVYCDHVKT